MRLPAGALVFLALLAAYATTLGLDATPRERYSEPEARRLLVVLSVAEDASLELSDEYAERAWRAFTSRPITPAAAPREGRLLEPQDLGFTLLALPAYAVAGPIGVELLCAALLALAFALAAAVARRVVPDPWATGAVVLAGLSPPALAGATAVSPAAAAAALLAGGTLLALRAREQPTPARAAGAAALLALLPWLGVRLIAPGLVLTVALLRWLRRRRRGLARLVAFEVLLSSAVAFLTVNDRLYGQLLPGAGLPGEAGALLDRAPGLLGVLLDAEAGLLRWAPLLALAGASVALLVRSRRDLVARALPQRADVEVAVGLLAATFAAGLGAAALLAPALRGPWLVPDEAVAVLPLAGALLAWGLRFAPRAGAVLGALTLSASVWLVLGARLGSGGFAPPSGPLPWGVL